MTKIPDLKEEEETEAEAGGCLCASMTGGCLRTQ